MKVKLLDRDPDNNQRREFDRYKAKVNCLTSMEASWALHDAAPDDATRALVELVQASKSVLVRHAGVKDKPLADLYNAIDRLRATPEGAALIRQAEEWYDG